MGASNLFVCDFVKNRSEYETMCFGQSVRENTTKWCGRVLVAGMVLRNDAFCQTPKVLRDRGGGDAHHLRPFVRAPTRIAGICGHRTDVIEYAIVLPISDLLAIPHAGHAISEIYGLCRIAVYTKRDTDCDCDCRAMGIVLDTGGANSNILLSTSRPCPSSTGPPRSSSRGAVSDKLRRELEAARIGGASPIGPYAYRGGFRARRRLLSQPDWP